ncbi:enoyl-CoA hydratase/isomerase family protein [Roseateles sp. P5_E11]
MTIESTIRGAVTVLTIARPQALNAFDVPTLRELRSLLAALQEHAETRCIVLTGSGQKAFCAGADLKQTRDSGASYAQGIFHAPNAAADLGLYLRLMDLSDLQIAKPVVAAINGHCLGAGLEIALQCDIRIAAENATFGLPETRIGSIPGVSGLHRLLKTVGSSQAMQMALTGERLAAADAWRTGLVSEVLPAETLMERAIAIAELIAANAPLAVQAVTRLSRETRHLSDADAQRLTELYWGALRDTEDRREGRAAFADKRTPTYTGR